MAAAIWDSPTTGTARSVQVPASAYFNLGASSGVGLFVAGAVPYVVYVPSSTAIATQGWTGLPYRVLVYWATGSSAFTDGGTGTTPATNVGNSAVDNDVNLGAKLGYGTANDGHLSSALQTWPTLVVFVQLTAFWNGTTNNFGAASMIHNAVVADVFKNYNCDPNFIYGCGASLGATYLEEYIMAQMWWPTRYPVRYAAVATVAAAPSGSGTRQAWPEAIPGETSTTQTFPRLGTAIVRKNTTPWIKVNSVGDGTNPPAQYNFLVDPIKQAWPNAGNPIPAGTSAGVQSFHGRYFRFYEYQGGSAPNHASPTCIFDYFFGGNPAGLPIASPGAPLVATDPWPTWMFQQKLQKPPIRGPVNNAYNYAGGSSGPGTTGSGGLGLLMRRRRRD